MGPQNYHQATTELPPGYCRVAAGLPLGYHTSPLGLPGFPKTKIKIPLVAPVDKGTCKGSKAQATQDRPLKPTMEDHGETTEENEREAAWR